jgi:hypothetical protein
MIIEDVTAGEYKAAAQEKNAYTQPSFAPQPLLP